MKRALLFIACVLASISMQADKTEINEQNFPDKNFRNYVLSTAVDRNQNNILDDDEILRVTNIDVHQKGIVSLKGIEYFTELQKLTCYQNNLTELDLSACTKLDFLNCASNKLTSLNLSGCAKLEWIRCDGNQLPELDVSACTELDTLVCSANKISTLDVSACTKLDYLNCQYINISKLDVSNNTELVTLYCDMNHLTELDLSKNTKLEVCTCSGNGMTKLILSKDNVLNYLGCSTNKLYGAAMEHIVENLNYQQQGGSLDVFNAENKDLERNVITTKQVETLKRTGYICLQRCGGAGPGTELHCGGLSLFACLYRVVRSGNASAAAGRNARIRFGTNRISKSAGKQPAGRSMRKRIQANRNRRFLAFLFCE